MEATDKPLVSVILCFFNEERFIGEAIESVLAQDHNRWELLLVDDGSIDRSTAIAKQYASRYPDKIRYMHHRGHCNEGLSASRNLGIESAQGDYVAFIDADDVWLPDKLSAQLNIFRRTNVTVVLEASQYWNSWTDPSKPDVIVPVGVQEGIYRPPQLSLTLYPLGAGAAPCPSGMMVRRSVLDNYGFEESFRGIYQMYEDQAFLCKVYLKEVVYVSAAWHNRYRQRPTSLVASISNGGKYHMVRSYFLQWFSQYLKYQKTPYRRVKALVQRARMPYIEPFRYKVMVDYPKMAKALAAKVLVKLGILSYSKT